MKGIWALFALLFCFNSVELSYAQEEVRDSATGEYFPLEVSFDYNGKAYHLKQTGESIRKKFFVKVYRIASYLEEQGQPSSSEGIEDRIDQIMQGNKAKQLTIKWVHNVDLDRFQKGYQESFQKAAEGSNMGGLQNEIDRFISFFNGDIQKGDVHILRWLPDGNIEVLVNDKKVGSIKNNEFAHLLWSIWFGPKSVVNRNSLVSRMS